MTEFHETVTLVAALDGDIETMSARIADMLPSERRALATACNAIVNDISLYCEGCGGKLDPAGPYAALLRGTWHPECAKDKRAEANAAAQS